MNLGLDDRFEFRISSVFMSALVNIAKNKGLSVSAYLRLIISQNLRNEGFLGKEK